MRALPVLLTCLASWVAVACSSPPQVGEPVTKTAEQPLALPNGFVEEDIGGTVAKAGAVLVKGSRFMRMERMVDALVANTSAH